MFLTAGYAIATAWVPPCDRRVQHPRFSSRSQLQMVEKGRSRAEGDLWGGGGTCGAVGRAAAAHSDLVV